MLDAPKLMTLKDFKEGFTLDDIENLPYITSKVMRSWMEWWALDAEATRDLIMSWGDYDYGMQDILKPALEGYISMEKELIGEYTHEPILPILPYLFDMIDWRKEEDRYKEDEDFKPYEMAYLMYYVYLFFATHCRLLNCRLGEWSNTRKDDTKIV